MSGSPARHINQHKNNPLFVQSLQQNKQSRSKAHRNSTDYIFVIHIRRIP
jgi:hypothetical protein